MPVGRVSDKGQLTIPADIRRRQGIAPGSRVEIIERGDELVIRLIQDLRELYGVFHESVRGKRPLSWEEQRAQAEEAVAREVADE